MNYEEMIKVIASKKSTLDEGDLVVRDMTKVINDILEYRYTAEHHKGNKEKVLKDKAMIIRNSMAVLESDLDIYQEMLGITEKVDNEKENRVEKIASRVS